jgi:hypothetical protein
MQSRKLFVLITVILALIPLSASGGGRPFGGAVYVLSNAPEGNEVIVFHRDSHGSLAPAGAYATAGLGTGGGIDFIFARALKP